jgi:hypothetical protein
MIQHIHKKINSLFNKQTYSKFSKKILKEYGNQTITKIEIGKTPLPQYVRIIANIVTLGQFEKNMPFDIYHFFLKITLNSNTVLTIEKNEFIILKKWKYRSDAIYTNVILPKSITLKKLLSKTKKRMGNQYFAFDTQYNNCEYFMIHLLKIMKIKVPHILNNDLSNLFYKLTYTKYIWYFFIYIRKIIHIIKN